MVAMPMVVSMLLSLKEQRSSNGVMPTTKK